MPRYELKRYSAAGETRDEMSSDTVIGCVLALVQG